MRASRFGAQNVYYNLEMGELIQIPLASSSDTAVLSFEDVPVKEEGDTNESHELVVRSYVARKLRIPLVNLFGQPEAVKHLSLIHI